MQRAASPRPPVSFWCGRTPSILAPQAASRPASVALPAYWPEAVVVVQTAGPLAAVVAPSVERPVVVAAAERLAAVVAAVAAIAPVVVSAA